MVTIKIMGWLLFAALLGCIVYLAVVLSYRDIAGLFQLHESIEVNGEMRSYRVYDPNPELDSKPMIIALHGLRDRGKWIELYTGLSNLAREGNFVVVYPEGTSQSWNGQVCCGKAFVNNIDDISFIEKLVARETEANNVDSSRIYITGFSNGGLMAQRLIAELPNTFAAGASAMAGIGSTTGEIVNVTNAKAPVMLMHGTNDRYSPLYPTGPNLTGEFQFTSVEQTWQYWADHYQLGAVTLENTDSEPDITVYGENQLVTKLYESRHRWPQWRLNNPGTKIPDSTREMWEFFKLHQLN